MDYYQDKRLSFSSVRQFAQNPARAMADFKDEFPFFTDKKALNMGQIVHAGLEDFLKGTDEVLKTFLDETDGLRSSKKPYGLLAIYKDADMWLEKFKETDILQYMKQVADGQIDGKTLYAEAPFFGSLEGIDYKGKLDVYIVDEKNKRLEAYDFKTSTAYDASGNDWGELISGEREYGSVIWHVEKLFPWQAGAYRELLRQNGYADYEVSYQYLVMTKEKTPRFDIWTLDDETMDSGLEAFRKHLVMANEYVTGKRPTFNTPDGSAFYNLSTQKQGNLLFTGENNTSEKEIDLNAPF